MTEWIESNLEPCPGEELDLHYVADRFVRRSTSAERQAIPKPEVELRRLLPVDGRTIVGYRFRPDASTHSDRLSEGPVWRRPRHVSDWNKK